MSENIILKMNGEDFESTPDNTSLFNFIGELASRDHVFIQTGVGDLPHIMVGTYVFKPHPVYERLAAHLVENGYPMHLNLRRIPQSDEKAYNDMIDRAVEGQSAGDFIPDGWV